VRIGRRIGSGLTALALVTAGGSTFYIVAAQEAAKSLTTLNSVYSESQAMRGTSAYKESCAACHGDTLGGSDQAPALAGDDFMTRWEEQLVSDLADRIRTSMPLDSPGSLSAATTADIVAYILQVNSLPAGASELTSDGAKTIRIRKNAGNTLAAAKPLTTLDSVYSESQAMRGTSAYKESCATCHGDTLGGSDQAPALAGDDFMLRWEEQLVSDLADRIRTSMPLDSPGSLSAATTADIVAFILQSNSLPAGTSELTSDGAKTIKIKRKV
jgi:mono/diheme cytochrome c family protein